MGLFTSAATVFLLCACGTGLTLYAVHVQRSRQDDESYKALCDIDSTITCSDIIAEDRDFLDLLKWVCDQVGMKYNDKFNPRQPPFMISFFPLLCFLGCLPITFSYFVATLFSSVSSLVSAYLLYMQFQVHNQICLPCIAGYFIHMLLFLVLTLRWANSGTNNGADKTVSPTKSQSSKKGSKGSQKTKQTSKSKKERVESDDQQSASSSGKEEKMDTVKSKGNIHKRK